MAKNNIFNFERLAAMAVERELRKQAAEIKDFDIGITVFQTEHTPDEEKRTVTVWFELKSNFPQFWDVKPVIIIYHNHNLYLNDICERTAEYFHDSVMTLNRRYMKQFIPRRI